MKLNAIKITVLDDYKLIIKYDTEEIKFIDLKDIIFKYDCWKELRDKEFFEQAFIDEFKDAPCWPNNLNMNPIEIYNIGVLINESQYRMKIARKILEEHRELFKRLADL